MAEGTPVNRQWVLVLQDGTIAIDWGDTVFQDVRSGDFITVAERDISHHIVNEDLEWLIKIGRVKSFTTQTVFFCNLPERPQQTIE